MLPVLPDPDSRFEMWLLLSMLTRAHNPYAVGFFIGMLIVTLLLKVAGLTIARPVQLHQSRAIRRSLSQRRRLRGAVRTLALLCGIGAIIASIQPLLGVGLTLISLAVLAYIIVAERIAHSAQREEEVQHPAPPPLPDDISIADVISWKRTVDAAAQPVPELRQVA